MSLTNIHTMKISNRDKYLNCNGETRVIVTNKTEIHCVESET